MFTVSARRRQAIVTQDDEIRILDIGAVVYSSEKSVEGSAQRGETYTLLQLERIRTDESITR